MLLTKPSILRGEDVLPLHSEESDLGCWLKLLKNCLVNVGTCIICKISEFLEDVSLKLKTKSPRLAVNINQLENASD